MVPEEKIGVGDVFEVRVVSEPELSGPYQVASDGTISFPFAGRIPVLGLDPRQVQELIATRLRDGYIRNPQVSLRVTEWHSRKISVLGQVQKPGPVEYQLQMTIVDALSAAGGFTAIAAKNSVKVTRTAGGKLQTYTYRVADITEGRSPNVVLMPGDVILVDERLF